MTTPITPLPEAPTRADGATFAPKADAFLGALQPWGAAVDLVGSEVTVLAAEVYAMHEDVMQNAGGRAARGTSDTSVAVATGTQTFTTQAELSFSPGMTVMASSHADPAAWMWGAVTSYGGTTLELNVLQSGGSGTHADWDLFIALPPPSGGPGMVPRVTATGTGYELVPLVSGGLGAGGVMPCAGPGRVAADERTLLDITAAAVGTLIDLPDATTLPVGRSYVMSQRAGTNVVGLLDAEGNILARNQVSAGSAVVLADNSTPAGTWKLLDEKLQLSAAPTAFRTVTGQQTTLSVTPSCTPKALLQVDDNDFLLAAGETSSAGVRLYWLRTDGLAITQVASAILSGSGSAVQRIELLRMASGSFVLIRRCSSSNDTQATAFTLAGSSITAGTTVNLHSSGNTNPATAGQYGLAWSAAVNGDKLLLLSWSLGAPSAGVWIVAASVSGTSITVGTASSLRATGGNYAYGSAVASPTADTWLVAYGTEDSPAGIYTRVITAAGLTLTAGTEATVSATNGAVSLAVASSGLAWLLYLPKSTTVGQMVPLTIAGTSVSVGTPAGLTWAVTADATVLSTTLWLMPGDRAAVFVGSGQNNAISCQVGGVGTGAWVHTGGSGISAASNNIHIAGHRLGGLGIVFSDKTTATALMVRASDGTIENSMSLPGLLVHALGANARDTAALLLPGDRMVVVAEPASTNVVVQAFKLSGF